MNDKKRIIHLLILISTMFLGLLTYLLYINMFEAETIASNPYNMRQWDEELSVHRGDIYDRNGVVLAETEKNDDGTTTRVYPEKNLYSHVIGYYSRVYGKSLLEREFDSMLNGKGDMSLTLSDMKMGFNLNLSIDDKIQKAAYEALNGRKGAVIAMHPKTGEVYAMVSLPDFDSNPSALEENWNDIVEDENSPLVNRAVSGLYPPGSTFKIVTAAAAFENGMTDRVFEDVGKFTLGGLEVSNFNNEAFGTINFAEAFKHSSNQVFCTIGSELSEETMLDITNRFRIGKAAEFDIETAQSTLGYEELTAQDRALVAIGQGKLLVTPLDMLLICSTVANDGNMPKPYLVKTVTKESGAVVYRAAEKNLASPISKACADYLKELMVETVKSGTGKNAALSNVTVAGKTGTAENEKEKDHSWFVGFAPAEDPEIAVSVILENDGGSGGASAAPVAREVFSAYFSD